MVENLLTVEEFAEWTRLSPTTIYAKVKSGEIQSYRLGERSIRIPAPELPAFMAKSVTSPPVPQSGTESEPITKTG